MKNNKRCFATIDFLYILIMVLPFFIGILIKVLTSPLEDGIVITGAQIFFSLPLPYQDLPITESQVNSWLVMISILGFCLYLTHGIKEKAVLKRQLIAEWIVEQTEKLVNTNMGEFFGGFAPFVAAILSLSAISSLLSLLGLYSPTSDLNIVAGWSILVFILITYYKFKCGPLTYVKSFAEPISFIAPLNVISEFATPLSMAFRHYGNILSGYVISVLVAAGLKGLSALVLGWLPGFLGEFPFLQIGLPAVLSIYFDLFSGCLQAYIFAMLMMLYVSSAFPAEEYYRKRNKKQKTVTQ